MPITNPVSLPPIAFSKNTLDLVLKSDDYLATAAVKSVNFLEFDAAIAADTVFTLDWAEGVATMTAKVAPDNSGLQFPSGDGSTGYVTGLLAWFNGNPFISRDFVLTTDFTGAHPRIIFTAINNGPDYDFLTFNGGASGVITHGVTDKPISNFMHYLELFIASADGSVFAQCFEANISLDYPVTGKTTTDIHEALHAFLTFDKPELSDAYAICANSIRQYYFKYAQFYGSVPFVHKIITSAKYFIAKGGLGKQANVLRTMVQELCPGSDATKFRFLRQGSINKLVSPEQPEWLTWINFASTSKTVSLEVVIYNDDATSFTFYSVAALTVAGYQKTQFPCGFTQLDIAARQALKTPVYYTVRVKEDAANYLTAAYAFVIDYTYRPWPRYFVYENSYGAFQTIGTVGKGLNEYDRTKDDAQMAVNQNQAALDGEFLEVNILIQEKGTVNIGYDRAGKRNTALLRDLLLSHKNYLWQSGALMPIGLNTKNLKDAADGVYVYANSFEYYPLYNEEVFTEDPAQVQDDLIADLLAEAGVSMPTTGGGGGTGGTGGAIIVEFGDTHLGTDGGHQSYTAAVLLGLTNYRIWSTQLGMYFRTADIAYNSSGFTILIDGFALIDGEQLIILPYVLNPDA